MSKVFIIDAEKLPLTPVHPGRARLLLKGGKAAVYRRYPFTLILKNKVEQPMPAPLRLKIDPGAKTTGLALVDDATGEVVWAAELTHRGTAIKKALDTRRVCARADVPARPDTELPASTTGVAMRAGSPRRS